jgi:hypothetical protein
MLSCPLFQQTPVLPPAGINTHRNTLAQISARQKRRSRMVL